MIPGNPNDNRGLNPALRGEYRKHRIVDWGVEVVSSKVAHVGCTVVYRHEIEEILERMKALELTKKV